MWNQPVDTFHEGATERARAEEESVYNILHLDPGWNEDTFTPSGPSINKVFLDDDTNFGKPHAVCLEYRTYRTD